MPDRILIVARLATGGSDEVAHLFAESDAGDLPHALGVTRRDLFHYRDLYFHHIEFDQPAGAAMRAARDRDDFRDLSDRLASYVTPYDPATWREPADAMATRFYHWTPEGRSL